MKADSVGLVRPDAGLEHDRALRAKHRRLRTRLHHYIFGSRALVLLTAPLIYSVAVPPAAPSNTGARSNTPGA